MLKIRNIYYWVVLAVALGQGREKRKENCFCFETMKHVFILHGFFFYCKRWNGRGNFFGKTHAVINLINE
jgi:hypothetical protein